MFVADFALFKYLEKPSLLRAYILLAEFGAGGGNNDKEKGKG